MSYAELFNLEENIPDYEIMRLLSLNKRLQIGDTTIIEKELKTYSGDFSGPAPPS